MGRWPSFGPVSCARAVIPPPPPSMAALLTGRQSIDAAIVTPPSSLFLRSSAPPPHKVCFRRQLEMKAFFCERYPAPRRFRHSLFPFLSPHCPHRDGSHSVTLKKARLFSASPPLFCTCVQEVPMMKVLRHLSSPPPLHALIFRINTLRVVGASPSLLEWTEAPAPPCVFGLNTATLFPPLFSSPLHRYRCSELVPSLTAHPS